MRAPLNVNCWIGFRSVTIIMLDQEKPMTTFQKRRSIHSLALVTMLLLTSTALSMQHTVVRRVRFPRGRTTVVLKGTVVNNTLNNYLLNARAGQTMSVHLTSPSGKAWFDLYPRNDRGALADSAEDTKDFEGRLPQSGDYVISVYSETGTTRYTLEVTVR